ncbi:hypothetical protein Tco_0517974 [Tanacetum coccineum]
MGNEVYSSALQPNGRDSSVKSRAIIGLLKHRAHAAMKEAQIHMGFCTKSLTKEAQCHNQRNASLAILSEEINDLDKDAKITLVNETQGRYGDEDMFGVNDLDSDEVVVEGEVTDKAGKKRNIVEEAVAVTDVVYNSIKSQGLKDKGKAKMIEPKKPLKKKYHIKFDKEEALRLQEKFNEEDRLAREKAQQVEEANIAWDDIQAKIDADYQLAERLQAQEQ